MPYVLRDDLGRIVCLYGALDPLFQQARNYLSTGKLQERLGEYDAVHAEAARLGLSFDDAVTDICSRWPEWLDDAELDALTDPAESGVFDSEPALEEIREAYEESHAANDPEPDEVGLGEPAVHDPGDSGVDDSDASGDDLAEEAADSPPDDPDPSDAPDEPDPAQLGGVLIRELGDALTTAKAIALMAVDDERFQRVGDYDKAANQARLDELRAIQQAIREGVHPAFTDEQTEELQALETFLPFIQRIDDYAQGLRDAIREAGDLEALASIDLVSGWPE